MPEQVVGTPPVEESVESVTQQPAAPANDDLAALRAKLELVQKDNLSKGEANRTLNERLGESEKRLRELEGKLKTTTQQTLESSGEYKQLWNDATAENARLVQRISDLEAQLNEKDSAISAERLRATAINAISAANALAPEQLYGLLAPQLRDSHGTPVVVVNGIEHPLDAHLQTLRSAGSGWDHHFAAVTARGMGATASASPAAGTRNPYKTESFNLTEALRLEADNPELARALKAEAGRG
jgi:cell division septum initiation protein DivIVA